jgi:hypothetical protein
VIVLPAGASGAGMLEGSSPLAVAQGDRIRISGPFPPGTTSVQVGYRYRYTGETATFAQPWPAAFEQLFVAAEKVAGLQMSSPQFQQQQEATAGGAPFLMATGGRLNAGDTLTIDLAGLPHHDPTLRNVGLAVGVFILAAGFWFGLSRSGAHDNAAGLAARKEKLLADMVVLEEQHRQGRVDERRYAGRRHSLMSQLERVMAEIDGVAPSERPRAGGPGNGIAA